MPRPAPTLKRVGDSGATDVADEGQHVDSSARVPSGARKERRAVRSALQLPGCWLGLAVSQPRVPM